MAIDFKLYLDKLPEERRRAIQERTQELLLEGIVSGPATPMTGADWKENRREVKRRYEARGSKKSDRD